MPSGARSAPSNGTTNKVMGSIINKKAQVPKNTGILRRKAIKIKVNIIKPHFQIIKFVRNAYESIINISAYSVIHICELHYIY